MSARVDGARAEAGVDVAVSSPLAPRLRCASSLRPSETERGRARTEPPRLRRVSSIKKAPPPHRGNRRWGGGCIRAVARMRAWAFSWHACAGTCAPREGSLKDWEDYPRLGVGMGGKRKGERGKGGPCKDKLVDEIADSTSPAVRGDEYLLSTGQHAWACRPYRARVQRSSHNLNDHFLVSKQRLAQVQVHTTAWRP